MKLFTLTKKKFFHILLGIAICFVLVNVYNRNSSKYNSSADNVKLNEELNLKKPFKKGKILSGLKSTEFKESLLSNNFMIPLKKERINELFKILLKFEDKFQEVFKQLDVLMFADLIKNNKAGLISSDISNYLNISETTITATDEFLYDLRYLSNYYSYVMPRNFVEPKAINVRLIFFLNLFRIYFKILNFLVQ